MNRTGHFRLIYYAGGDLYRASDDIDRMTVIDNQLETLSSVVGDGILEGWDVTCPLVPDGMGGFTQDCSSLSVWIAPGTGFINNVLHKTLSFKVLAFPTAALFDDATNLIYLQSTLLDPATSVTEALGTTFVVTGGFSIEVESPLSQTVIIIFTDSVAPADVTGLQALVVPATNAVNLAWDANTEIDFDHYQLQRLNGLTVELDITRDTNPVIPAPTADDGLQDTDLAFDTTYTYRVRAIDRSGNASNWVTSTVTTPQDTRLPADITNLRMFPGRDTVAVSFDASKTGNVISYRVSYSKVLVNGSLGPEQVLPETLEETYLLAGLDPNAKYRITIKARSSANGVDPAGNLSGGVTAESITIGGLLLKPPLAPIAAAVAGGVALTWTHNPFNIIPAPPTPALPGELKTYRIVVIQNNLDSANLDIGTVSSKTLLSYNDLPRINGVVVDQSIFGASTLKRFKPDVDYLFKITAVDPGGNESGPVLVKGQTVDTAVPNRPRAVVAEPGDSAVLVTWENSTSEDVDGYNISYDAGLGFVPDVQLGRVNIYQMSGLTNGTSITVRVRARDDAGNLSADSLVAVTPAADTQAPATPDFVQVNVGDTQAKISWRPNTEQDLSKYILKRQHVENRVDSPPNSALVVIDEVNFEVNKSSASFVDTGLVNDDTYAYSVAAEDIHGNQSIFSAVTLTSPNEGLNSGTSRVVAPIAATPTVMTGVLGTFVRITWTFASPISDPISAFNIYRSDTPVIDSLTLIPIDGSDFQVIASVGADDPMQYDDYTAISGTQYFYKVSAIRDDAIAIRDSGSIQPANSILLAAVKTSGGSVQSIEQVSRIAKDLHSTIEEEALSRLLSHKHSVKAINSTSVTAVSSLAMIDVNDLPDIDLTLLQLSTAANEYYSLLSAAENDAPATANTTFIISPTVVVNNVPFAGDFQVLVNGAKPTGAFRFDDDRNAIVFIVALKSTDAVTVDGQGTSYYVPTELDLSFRGYDVLVNDAAASGFGIDEQSQTIRFLETRAAADVVTLTIEPRAPDFGVQGGARQVSLSPDTVISDFEAVNQTTWTSLAGGFSQGDIVTVLVDGAPTSLKHFVDFANSSIVFDDAVPAGSSVALEVRGKEEVTGLLPAKRISGVDGSQFTSGKFLTSQLPELSHAGRVKERALPVFESLSSTNKYVYPASAGNAGTGSTPYAAIDLLDGNIILGSSSGLSKTSTAGIFLSDGDKVSLSSDLRGATFGPSDTILEIARKARSHSGRVRGVISLDKFRNGIAAPLEGKAVSNPCMIELNDGTVLICGGEEGLTTRLSMIYDPSNGEALKQGDMISRRTLHACVRLESGNVLASGGLQSSFDNYPPIAPPVYYDNLASCEVFDPITGLWTATGTMSVARNQHSLTLLSSSDVPGVPDVLGAGGETWTKIYHASTDNPYFTYTIAELNIAQRFSEGSGTWASAAIMPEVMSRHEQKNDSGFAILDTSKLRLIYDSSTNSWSRAAAVLSDRTKIVLQALDGPAKQFFRDSFGSLWAITRNNAYVSSDEGATWLASKGFDSVGTIHRLAEDSAGFMFAATDLGVYELAPDQRGTFTWFQGPLIGAGTTETFDLQQIGTTILAGTEIGVFRYYRDVNPANNAWTQVLDEEDVFNIELMGVQTIFAQIGNELWRSDASGAAGTWSKIASFDFMNNSSKLLARSPLDIFAGTDTGLYSSADGISFSLVNFDVNRNPQRNNVSMLDIVGGDVVVGYDNAMFTIDPAGNPILVGEFLGAIPTVFVNGEEARGGFRYDTVASSIVFESKRRAPDTVQTSANYSLYKMSGGPWYHQNPSAPFTVYVNGKVIEDDELAFDARLGQVSFLQANNKYDLITATIAGTTLKNEGELFHEELEDKIELEKGLRLGLGRNKAADVLQMGLSIEHNFWEQGFEREQYYCSIDGLVERSFNSFLDNAEFYILGRRDYDTFNSTIDYAVESEQNDIGEAGLVPFAVYDNVIDDEVWVATDVGIFVMTNTPSAPTIFSVTSTIPVAGEGAPVKDVKDLNGEITAISTDPIRGDGVYSLEKIVSTWTATRNEGKNLPDKLNILSSFGNIKIVGTESGISYTDADADPPYGEWFSASFFESVDDVVAELDVDGNCADIMYSEGAAFAAIDNAIFISADGKSWRRIFVFDEATYGTIVINKIAAFAKGIYLATNKGIWGDGHTARQNTVLFSIQLTESTEDDSKAVHMNDMFSTDLTALSEKALYAVGETGKLYKLVGQSWTSEETDLAAIHKFLVRDDGMRLAFVNSGVFVG